MAKDKGKDKGKGKGEGEGEGEGKKDKRPVILSADHHPSRVYVRVYPGPAFDPAGKELKVRGLDLEAVAELAEIGDFDDGDSIGVYELVGVRKLIKKVRLE